MVTSAYLACLQLQIPHSPPPPNNKSGLPTFHHFRQTILILPNTNPNTATVGKLFNHLNQQENTVTNGSGTPVLVFSTTLQSILKTNADDKIDTLHLVAAIHTSAMHHLHQLPALFFSSLMYCYGVLLYFMGHHCHYCSPLQIAKMCTMPPLSVFVANTRHTNNTGNPLIKTLLYSTTSALQGTFN